MSLQTEIINELGVKPTIDPKEEIRKSIDFMKAYLKKYPFLKTFVLGISGGQDSTLAGRLAQLTMEEMREETKDENYQFIAVRLPYGEQADEEDAKAALDFIPGVVTFSALLDNLIVSIMFPSSSSIDTSLNTAPRAG